MKHFFCIILAAFSFMFLAEESFAQGAGVKVIVIDAGHGGSSFPGASYKGVKEKDINLKVALKLGALIEKELPAVKVVYTRTTDKALGKTLNEDLSARANIANKAGGDFFISIHANAAPKATSVMGAETIIMGESEKETRYNEDTLYNANKDELIDMSDENTAAMVRAYIQNLQFTYGEYSEMMARIMQKHYVKGGRKDRKVKRQLLKVLYATDMPSVLTELGFMSNAKELAYMNSEKGQNELARMLCNAVKEYVGYINRLSAGEDVTLAEEDDAQVTVENQPEELKPEEKTKAQENTRETMQEAKTQEPKTVVAQNQERQAEVSDSGYTIQILASDKQVKTTDSQFKGYRGKVNCYIGGGVLKYKYCYGSFSSRSEASQQLAAVKRSFKDAFVVRYSQGKIVK
ncbi:MAG: N-acetylmuramoyl-L-alanine amidase [Alistipes sp.]|nr:N-acetylmuramoyl-L-alanine amidase [Alistipes sp.]